MFLNLRKNVFYWSIFCLVLSACAHMPTTGGRSVKTLMPLMQSQYKALESRVRVHQIDPVPETQLTELRRLVVELKDSPRGLYTQDAALWQRSCDEMLAQVDALTQAWVSKDEPAIVTAFANLKAGRQASHDLFK